MTEQEGLITKSSYAYYVLVILTLCYVVNVVDRSQVLAASVQSIKKEFGASDFQMGMLSGLPFVAWRRPIAGTSSFRL